MTKLKAKVASYFKIHPLTKKQLLLSVVLALLIASPIIWYLEQTYAPTLAKIYSVLNMDKDKRYLLKTGDYLVGRAIPNTSITLVASPGNIRYTLPVDKKGQWVFHFTPTLPHQSYQLVAINRDKNQQLVSAKRYKVRLQSNDAVVALNPATWLPKWSFLKDAKAINGGPGTDYDWDQLTGRKDWKPWLIAMQQTGVFPAINDAGKIDYYSKNAFYATFPNAETYDTTRSSDYWQTLYQKDKGFFQDLYISLCAQGYTKDTYASYFPDLEQFLSQGAAPEFCGGAGGKKRPGATIMINGTEVQNTDANLFTDAGLLKPEILEAEVKKTILERGWQEKSILFNFILYDYPILTLRSYYNCLSQFTPSAPESVRSSLPDPYPLISSSNIFNCVTGVLIFVSPTKEVGKRVAEETYEQLATKTMVRLGERVLTYLDTAGMLPSGQIEDFFNPVELPDPTTFNPMLRIIDIQGDLSPGNEVAIDTVTSQDGQQINPDKTHVVFALERSDQVQAFKNTAPTTRVLGSQIDLTKTLASTSNYYGGNGFLKIPDLESGSYRLTAYLIENDTDQILASDYYLFSIGEPAVNTLTPPTTNTSSDDDNNDDDQDDDRTGYIAPSTPTDDSISTDQYVAFDEYY